MIEHIHERLEKWAEWQHLQSRSGSGSRIGWSSRSPEQRGLEMRNYATRGLPRKPRRDPPTFPVHTPKQTRGHIEIPSPRDPEAEAMDRAISQMPMYMRDAVKMKYLYTRPDRLAAEDMRVSVATYKAYINVAHGWLDGHFCQQSQRVGHGARISA